MIFGIGTDIVKIKRMRENQDKYGDRFAKRVLSDTEFSEYGKKANDNMKASFLAKRFAAKEAAVKAMGTGFTNGISMKHVTVENNQNGKPTLKLSGVAEKIADESGVTHTHLSIADESDYAVAYVVMEKSAHE